MSILKQLFGGSDNSETSDGFEQSEREGILDLLLLCIYADNHLSLAEDKVIKEQIDRFSWDSGTSLDLYIANATNNARKASNDDILQEDFLRSISERLARPDARAKALKLMGDLFHSDGESDSERVFSAKVKSFVG